MHHLIYHLCCLFCLYFKLEIKGVVNVDVDVSSLIVGLWHSKGWSYAFRYRDLAGLLRQVPGVKVTGLTGEDSKLLWSLCHALSVEIHSCHFNYKHISLSLFKLHAGKKCTYTVFFYYYLLISTYPWKMSQICILVVEGINQYFNMAPPPPPHTKTV